MSASPMARQAVESKAIPITRRVIVNDPNDLPAHLSSTPGGTLFSTTPGGTKIVYERSFMLHLRNSPLSKTPPNFTIPDHLAPGGSPTRQTHPHNHNHHPHRRSSNNHPPKSPLGKTPPREERKKSAEPVDDQFQIDL